MLDSIKRFFRGRLGRDRDFYAAMRGVLGITPDNADIYKLAFIHRSASVSLPDGTNMNNERLEFLGDAVLEAIVSDFLFIEYPAQTEGFLTQLRSRIVSRVSLDEIAVSIGLNDFIVVHNNSSYNHKHLCGNALEALIGAIYLDKGYNFTNRYVINKLLREHIDLPEMLLNDSDHKSRLIEWCQKSKRDIVFRTIHDTDSTMQKPKFMSTIIIDGIELGHGQGSSKKEAEQKAAYTVMQLVSDEVGDFFLDTIDLSMEKYNESDGKVN